jgi:hypothetical protein
MADYTLVILEATGIQPYVFGSNHLAQNIGASELVYRSTTEWLLEALDDFSSNVEGWSLADGLKFNNAQVTDGVEVEVVYAGGGNTMLLFAGDRQAQRFIQALTRRLLEDARGLQLIADHKQFTWNDKRKNLRAIDGILREDIGQRKLSRTHSTPLLGLGVTAACVFTGLPAVGNDQDPDVVGHEAAKKMAGTGAAPHLISAQVAAKIRAEDNGKKRLSTLLQTLLKGTGLDIVYDFDQFGEKGESRYIAVVHADANQMGERFKQLSGKAANDRDYVDRLRTLSRSVQENARDALQETVAYLLHSWDPLEHTFGYGERKVTVPLKNGHRYLPFRPIVFGGDDTTFVCDGRLGLPLAAKYLQAFTKRQLSDGVEEKPVFARAGVAVVKTHFPFSRAYELADDLAAAAKREIDKLKIKEESTTVMDWHFSTTGVIRELADIREREFKGGNKLSLLARPIRVGASNNGEWRNWEIFAGMVNFFQKDEAWAGRRNKLITMRDALREGPRSFRLFRDNYRIEAHELPELKGRPAMQLDGWDGEECGYFDAIEAVDFFVSLDPAHAKEAA